MITDVSRVPYPAGRGRCPFDPPPEYGAWRAGEPVTAVVLPSGRTAWLVTRHAEARAALRDPALRSDSRLPGYPLLGTAVESPPFNSTFIMLDGPEHASIRRMLIGEFTPGRVAALAPRIQELADDLADRMRPGDDLVSRFAQPLASQTICTVLGVPYTAHDEFERHVAAATDHTVGPEGKAEAAAALLGMLAELIETRRHTPRDDLVSRLLSANADRLTPDELLHTVALVLGAGVDTTAHMIGLSAAVLLRDPALVAELRRDPELVGNAVEELLRHQTIVQLGLCRVAVADTSIGGVRVRAGDGVIVSVQAANRDPDAFPRADDPELRRREARRHLAFGYGVHQCLGQSLARAQLRVAVSTVVTRFGSARIAATDDELRFTDAMDFYGLRELVLTW